MLLRADTVRSNTPLQNYGVVASGKKDLMLQVSSRAAGVRTWNIDLIGFEEKTSGTARCVHLVVSGCKMEAYPKLGVPF